MSDPTFPAVALALVREGRNLSLRQAAVLLEVCRPGGVNTVRHLAAHLRVSKPAITRAADLLGHLGLATRKKDENDRRSVNIIPTPEGIDFARKMGGEVA